MKRLALLAVAVSLMFVSGCGFSVSRSWSFGNIESKKEQPQYHGTESHTSPNRSMIYVIPNSR